MLVFLTGGNGFIGSSVARALVEQGHRVRCLVRANSHVDRLKDIPWQRIEGDVRDKSIVLRGMQGCDAAIHLAGPSNWGMINSPLMRDIGIKGVSNMLSAAEKQCGVRMVFVSSIVAVNGTKRPEIFDESSPFTLRDRGLTYSIVKREAESLCLEGARRGLPVMIVNPTEVYGPDDVKLVTAGSLIAFCKSKPVVVCDGGTSVVHVNDVAAGIIRALVQGQPGERYILGGENLTIRDLAALTLELVGLRRRIVRMPSSLLRIVAKAGVALRLPLPFDPHVIPYATRYWFVNNHKARDELGVTFRPARETLKSVLTWLHAAGHIPVAPQVEQQNRPAPHPLHCGPSLPE
ncbi:MAG TPA: NAD-dependent epimerase/dehydratase family protein [Pirellulales bacterium]